MSDVADLDAHRRRKEAETPAGSLAALQRAQDDLAVSLAARERVHALCDEMTSLPLLDPRVPELSAQIQAIIRETVQRPR